MTSDRVRRDRLEGNEGQEFARNNLVRVMVDDVNWTALHRDPRTGDCWKEFFPQSELHGGGPPVLVRISTEEAEKEFKVKLDK